MLQRRTLQLLTLLFLVTFISMLTAADLSTIVSEYMGTKEKIMFGLLSFIGIIAVPIINGYFNTKAKMFELTAASLKDKISSDLNLQFTNLTNNISDTFVDLTDKMGKIFIKINELDQNYVILVNNNHKLSEKIECVTERLDNIINNKMTKDRYSLEFDDLWYKQKKYFSLAPDLEMFARTIIFEFKSFVVGVHDKDLKDIRFELIEEEGKAVQEFIRDIGTKMFGVTFMEKFHCLNSKAILKYTAGVDDIFNNKANTKYYRFQLASLTFITEILNNLYDEFQREVGNI